MTATVPYLARSAGLHALMLGAAVLYMPGAERKADAVYLLDFIGGPAAIQAVGPSQAAPPLVAAEPKNKNPRTIADSFATKRRPAIPLPRPSLFQDSPQSKVSSQPTPPAAEPASATLAAMPGNAAGITTDLPNFPYPWYISQVRQMLWVSWQKRLPVSSGEGIVMFAIMRQGAFTDLRMESSSGDGDFDDAAIKSVRDAAPFPALPADFREPFLKIHLTLKADASWR